MRAEEIKGLMEAYLKVHETPEVLSEEVEQIDEMGQRMTTGQATAKPFKPTPGAGSAGGSGSGGRRGSGVNRNSTQTSSSPGALRTKSTAAPKLTPTPTAASKPTPAGGSVSKPAGAKPPATPAPAKPAGSAMDQWRAANPKLAAAADEKARIRGTSQTDNPLMKDMRSKMSMTPSVQSPEVAKLGKGNQSLVNNPNASKAAQTLKQDLDIFDLVKGHLLDEGYAETEENALVMMANMSEEWRDSIIMELTGGKGHPGYKAGSKDHGPMESGHPADSEKRKDKGGTMSMRHGHHLGDIDDEDEDEDDLESVVKQQSRDSRERVRKPLRDKVKAARKQITRESIEQLAEISKELATKAFATRARDAFEMDDNKQHDKADKTKERIVKKHGKKAGDEAEKAAERAIYGHNKYSEAQEREKEKKKSMKKEEVEINEKMEKWIEKVMLDEGHGSRTSFKKQSADERERINMFKGSKIEYTPHKNYDPKANRGQGQILRPNQVEKQRRKKLRAEDLEAWVDELIAEGYDLSDYTWEEVAQIYVQELELLDEDSAKLAASARKRAEEMGRKRRSTKEYKQGGNRGTGRNERAAYNLSNAQRSAAANPELQTTRSRKPAHYDSGMHQGDYDRYNRKDPKKNPKHDANK